MTTGTGIGLDKPDLLVARFPKPTQVLLTTWDTCFPLRGGLFAVNESQGAWAAAGAAEALDVHVAEHWHGYVQANRERLYAFLMGALSWAHAGNPSVFPGGHSNASELFVANFSLPHTAYPYKLPYPPFFRYQQLMTTSTGNVRGRF